VLAPCSLRIQTRWQWRGTGGLRLAEVVAERVPWLKAPAHLPRWGNVIAWARRIHGLPDRSPASPPAISRDVAWLALALALLLLAVLLRLVPLRVAGGLVHAAVFVTMATAVYLDHVRARPSWRPLPAKWVLFPVLALAVVMRLRFWRERRFEITTLDVLVVFLALVLPNLPGLQGAPSNIGLSVAKLVVLMYAAELLIRHSERTRAWLWVTTPRWRLACLA
jgi:UDP-GlcNAc:undecaprenyl-phosphate/decaprenyl-phosphate GlcNAc-1-phosphate transferase